MANNPKTYTIAQIAVAARELREAAGAEEERYTGAEVVALLEGEVQILRQRGFSNERITDLFTGFDIEVKPGQLDRRSKSPGNLITRLIWGRIGASKLQEQNN
jgi:hypothetical protein